MTHQLGLITLWFRHQPYTVPAGWDVFTADDWVLRRIRSGFRCSRFGFPPYTVRTR